MTYTTAKVEEATARTKALLLEAARNGGGVLRLDVWPGATKTRPLARLVIRATRTAHRRAVRVWFDVMDTDRTLGPALIGRFSSIEAAQMKYPEAEVMASALAAARGGVS